MRRTGPIFTASFALMLLFGLPGFTAAQESSPGTTTDTTTPDTAPATTTAPTSGQDAASETTPAATAGADAGWPCEQRLQPELSIGAVWSGPDPTAAADSWRQDNAVLVLVEQVAPRRVPQDQAITAIHRFAAGYGKDKTDVMTKVFAGLFEVMNDERGQIIRGIRHFNDRQKKLADRIQNGTKALDGLDPNSTDQTVADQRAALEQGVAWDSRIFDDRERLLPIVCSVPVAIEQRLFALSRAVGEELDSKN